MQDSNRAAERGSIVVGAAGTRTAVVPVIEERLEVRTETTPAGTVRVRIAVDEGSERVALADVREEYQPSVRAVGEPADARRDPYRDGDEVVIPVYEERVVVERRLFLKEEIRLRRARHVFSEERDVAVRRERAIFERLQADGSWREVPLSPGAPVADHTAPDSAPPRASDHPSFHSLESSMNQTVVGVFNSHEAAERAAQSLASQGFDRSHMHIKSTGADGTGTATASTSAGMSQHGEGTGVMASIRHFFAELFGDEDEHSGHYEEAVRRGGAVLAVESDERRVDIARDALLQAGAVDIEEQVSNWRSQGWSGSDGGAEPSARQQPMGERENVMPAEQQNVGAADERRNVMAGDAGRNVMTSDDRQNVIGGDAGRNVMASDDRQNMAAGDERQTMAPADERQNVVPVVQEGLEIGKRQVSGGAVRVVSRVVSRPVSESVELRREEAAVERHPVDRPATEADLAALQERTIEVTEMAERPVVNKTARVVEEVVVGKHVSSETQVVEDTVRRTEVEVERVGGDDSRRDVAFQGGDYQRSGRDVQGGGFQGGGGSQRDGSFQGDSASAGAGGVAGGVGSDIGVGSGDQIGATQVTPAGAMGSSGLGSGAAGSMAGMAMGGPPRSSQRNFADLDDEFRQDYQANHASSGVSYEDMQPAYRGGYESRGDTRFAHGDWDSAEPELRQRWESQNPGSAWERVKAAFRRGWDRATS